MRCDLHVHTIHSGMCSVPLMRKFCRESYNEPEAVYEKLKRMGMNLVTVTDHDSIDVVDRLGNKPDFFLSEEVTCRMPSGTEVHIAVYDINERQHHVIQRRRNDLPSLLAYLREQDILFALNHPFSSLTGRRAPSDFNWFGSAFPAVEVSNGQLLAGNNSLAQQLAEMVSIPGLGGSDGHTPFSIGRAFTEVPGARTCTEFLMGLRTGRAKTYGSHGSYWGLTRDVFWIALEMIREKPATGALLPLALAIPAVTFVNHLLEINFARRWGRFLARSNRRDGVSAPPAHLSSRRRPQHGGSLLELVNRCDSEKRPRPNEAHPPLVCSRLGTFGDGLCFEWRRWLVLVCSGICDIDLRRWVPVCGGVHGNSSFRDRPGDLRLTEKSDPPQAPLSHRAAFVGPDASSGSILLPFRSHNRFLLECDIGGTVLSVSPSGSVVVRNPDRSLQNHARNAFPQRCSRGRTHGHIAGIFGLSVCSIGFAEMIRWNGRWLALHLKRIQFQRANCFSRRKAEGGNTHARAHNRRGWLHWQPRGAAIGQARS